MEKKRKLKAFVLPSLYAIMIISMISITFFISESMRVHEAEEVIPVNEERIPQRVIPVVADPVQIINPFTNEEVKIMKSFYDYQAEISQQENSITFFNNIYMQSSGVSFALESDDIFEVVSVLDGTVANVREDELLGKVIEIKHDNNLVSIYQSLSEVIVAKGDTVRQGQVIGKSGTNQMAKDLGNHLHFELYHKGLIVNPEVFIGKLISELN